MEEKIQNRHLRKNCRWFGVKLPLVLSKTAAGFTQNCRRFFQGDRSFLGRERGLSGIALGLVMILLATSCSTTRNLPEGEVLYTGMKKTVIENPDNSLAGQNALSEVEAAIACPPNNAIPGSSRLRIPLPFGLWVFNS